jgi:hypothetical protein
MSVASITVSGGSQEASLTITPLGGNQDLLANVNRWRRQVGLDPIASLEAEPPVPVEVDGQPAHLVDLAGPEQHTLAVLAVRDGTTWFYKLSGPDPLVAEQRAAFSEFIESLRFPGATDG